MEERDECAFADQQGGCTLFDEDEQVSNPSGCSQLGNCTIVTMDDCDDFHYTDK